MKKVVITAVFFSIQLISSKAYSNGFMEPDGGTHNFYADIGNQDIVNLVGGEKAVEWNLGGLYSVKIVCGSNLPKSPFYFKSVTNLKSSSVNPGFFYLNDAVDVKVEVWIAGNLNKFVQAPFDNVSNQKVTTYDCIPPYETEPNVGTGSKGRVTFRIKKQIINGIFISNTEVVDVYGRMGTYTNAFGTTPISRVTITSGFLFVPEKCVVNQGQQINVEFGIIYNDDINGSNYTQNIPVSYECSGGIFNNGMMRINLAVIGSPASFTNEALRTDKKDLAIKLTHDGKLVIPNTYYPPSNYIGNKGEWNLVAAPLSNNTVVTEGDFNASATIAAAFP